jgi:hypothetical protein
LLALIYSKFLDKRETLKPEEIPLSRGPGHVERKIIEIFKRDQGDLGFSTYELCLRVFGTPDIEKKHRVSVLRALKQLSRRRIVNLWRIVVKDRADDVWFNYDERPPKAQYRSILGPAGDRRPRKPARQKYKRPRG